MVKDFNELLKDTEQKKIIIGLVGVTVEKLSKIPKDKLQGTWYCW